MPPQNAPVTPFITRILQPGKSPEVLALKRHIDKLVKSFAECFSHASPRGSNQMSVFLCFPADGSMLCLTSAELTVSWLERFKASKISERLEE